MKKNEERIEFTKEKIFKKLADLNINVDKNNLNSGYSCECALLSILQENKEENEKIIGTRLLDNI